MKIIDSAGSSKYPKDTYSLWSLEKDAVYTKQKILGNHTNILVEFVKYSIRFLFIDVLLGIIPFDIIVSNVPCSFDLCSLSFVLTERFEPKMLFALVYLIPH